MLHLGYDYHEVEQFRYGIHNELKSLFEPPQMYFNKLTGKDEPMIWSMREATKEKVMQFIDWAERWAAQEHGFTLELIEQL